MAEETCAHIEAVTTIKRPERYECSECMKIDGDWVHLRTCQDCGVTLCCDSSPHQHASKHAQASGHPVIASAQPNERWLYCYTDEALTAY